MLSERHTTILNEFEEQRKLVKYSVWDFPIWWIVEQYRMGKIKIPTYQRKFRWSRKRQSKFIESVLLWLPIPSIFLAKDAKDLRKKEIVDWSQRIRTLVSFMCDDLEFLSSKNIKKLRLTKLDILKSINWCDYNSLPDDLKNELSDSFLRINVLDADISSEIKIQIFERINNGSLELEPMEKRAGIYSWLFIDFIYSDLSDEYYDRWQSIYKLPEWKKDKALLEELILRTIAYAESINDEDIVWYTGSSWFFFDNFCQHMEEKLKSEGIGWWEEWKQSKTEEFNQTLLFFENNKRDSSGKSFLFKKWKNWYKATNSWFEAIFIGTMLAIKEQGFENLNIQNFIEWIESDIFKRVVSSDWSNDKNKVIDRILSVKKAFIWVSLSDIEESLLWTYR